MYVCIYVYVYMYVYMSLEYQIHIEWFLKDHVTLKTGVMMLKIHYLYINI